MSLELVRLTDTLSLVRGNNRGYFPNSHAFLVQDKVSALIDTGCGFDLLERVRNEFHIDLIINSHGHPDHSSGNWLFPDTPLHAPKFGAGTHGRLDLLARRFFGDSPMADFWPSWIRGVMGFRDREPTDYYDHNDVFDFGNLRLQAIHTPGHTADHFCLYEPNNRILLSFDLDLTSFGPWYGNLESDLCELRRSLAAIRDLRPLVIASSHANVIDKDVVKAVQAYASVLDRRSDALVKLLENSPTRNELMEASPIYYGHYPFDVKLLKWFEGRMIDQHMAELIEKGIAETDGARFRLA